MTHKCVNKLTIIGSDNGLSPDRRQAIIWTNAGILLIEPSGTNFTEIFIGIHKFSFKKRHLKMSSGKCQPFCTGLNVLNAKQWLAYGYTHWHAANIIIKLMMNYSWHKTRKLSLITVGCTHYITVPSHDIIAMSHEYHVVSTQLSFDCLFNRSCRPTSKKHQSLHYWPFVRGIHRWPANSSHKEPLTRKKLPCDDVIMTSQITNHCLFNRLFRLVTKETFKRCITGLLCVEGMNLSWLIDSPYRG